MGSSAVTAYLSNEALRRGPSRRKLFDRVFVLFGLIVMLACLAILAVLFIDLVRDRGGPFRMTSSPTSPRAAPSVPASWRPGSARP